MSSRFQRFIMVLAILLAPASAVVLGQSAAVVAQQAATATTTDALNMRTGASLNDAVILVIPYGATVTIRGGEQNGFLPIHYAGRDGWASRSYLALSTPSSNAGRSAVTTDSLNLRSGPSGTSPVIVVMPAGVDLIVNGESSNGYLAVTWSGFQGFAHRDWIRIGEAAPAEPTAPPPTGSAVTTDSLNMRAGAGTTFTVVTVMPSGATVQLTGQSANGFYGVTWNGKTGWASSQFLRVTGGQAPAPSAPAPTPPPSQPTTGTAVTTDDLNMRSGAGTGNAVILVIPRGATVALTGQQANGFLEVTYNGRTGWSSQDYLRTGSTPAPPVTETKGTATTTDSLNMRSGPATSYAVVTVMPAGASVVLTGQQSNGFYSVTFNGQTGWASGTYLNITPATAPPPTPAPTPAPTRPAPVPVTVLPKPWPEITSGQGYHWTNAIVGPTRGTAAHAISFAQRSGAKRMDQVELYINEIYRLGPLIGFDPSLLVAQSAVETGYWKSWWWETRLNPAGLSLNDDPSTHDGSPGFDNGTIAARAQMAHMHAEVFGERVSLPVELQGVDVSYEAVFRAGWAGDIVTLEDLGGTWASDTSYGYKIARVAAEIYG